LAMVELCVVCAHQRNNNWSVTKSEAEAKCSSGQRVPHVRMLQTFSSNQTAAEAPVEKKLQLKAPKSYEMLIQLKF